MNNLFLYLSIIFFIGAFFRAIQDIFLFHKEENIFYKLFKDTLLYNFYSSHNSIFECLLKDKCPNILKYNPTIILTCDFWHMIKKLEYVSYVLSLCLVTNNWYFILIYFILGFSFVIFYEYILRYPKQSLFSIIKKVLPFKDRKNN